MFRITLLAACLIASPALAQWTLSQGNGRAWTEYDAGRYVARISCSRGSGLELWVRDTTHSGVEMQGVRSLMMWVTLPDGRTDRWPVDVVMEGPGISGPLIVSNFNLEFFRNGQRFEIDSPQTGTVSAKGSMGGTGAARLAFQKQCSI